MLRLDAVIFGGGAAGLWLLDRISRDGGHVVLLESAALGAGQTIASQGIIHSGPKDTLQGLVAKSARHLRGMPSLWRDALLGRIAPNLTRTRLRSDCCFLWQADAPTSDAPATGVPSRKNEKSDSHDSVQRPPALAHVLGAVSQVAEQVVSPASFVADLSEQYHDRILRIDAENGLRFILRSPGEVAGIQLTDPNTGRTLELSPRQVIFTAGRGNAELRQRVGLDAGVMRLYPLQIVLARGDLPELNGHCIDGETTRLTITSEQDAHGRRVWQIGGEVAEVSAVLDPQELTQRVRREIESVVPGVCLDRVEWSTCKVELAEGVTEDGERPETVQVLCAGNVTTGWPTMLSLAPALALEIASRVRAVDQRLTFDTKPLADWPRPSVALLPWDEPTRTWWPVQPSTPHTPDVAPTRRAA